MNYRARWPLKVAYCVVILGAILPIGAAASAWVTLAVGRGGLAAAGLITSVALLIVGLYRIWTVVRLPGTLNAYEARGFARVLRTAGICALYAGALFAVVNWSAWPLMSALVTTRSDSGIEFFVVGASLSLFSGIGPLGLVSFELSRLLAFEAEAREEAVDAPRKA